MLCRIGLGPHTHPESLCWEWENRGPESRVSLEHWTEVSQEKMCIDYLKMRFQPFSIFINNKGILNKVAHDPDV